MSPEREEYDEEDNEAERSLEEVNVDDTNFIVSPTTNNATPSNRAVMMPSSSRRNANGAMQYSDDRGETLN